MTGFFRDGHKPKGFGFPALVKTGKGELSKGMVPTSGAYLKDAPHYAHIITAMAVMANAGLEVQVYLDSGRFCAYSTSSIRIYTRAAQRDDEVVLLKTVAFVSGMAVESGVNYDT